MTPLIFALISFIVVFSLTRWWIRYLQKIGLVVRDMQKENKPLIPLSGGVVVFVGIFLFFMFLIFYQTFFTSTITLHDLTLVFAGLMTIATITFVGFVDDLLLNQNKSASHGLSQWQKPILTLFAAIPLVVVNAGTSTMLLPFVGHVNFGILYPLFLIPLGVVGASNMVNILAGYNGLETGLGLVYFGNLGLYALAHERYLAAYFCIALFASLLAFYFFNRYPAKILPGDSLTYLMGAGLVVVAVVGNIEKAALIVSLPFFVELVFKLRGKLNVRSYGYLKNDKIHSFYTKIYSLPHFLARTGKFTERQITLSLITLEIFVSSLIWVL